MTVLNVFHGKRISLSICICIALTGTMGTVSAQSAKSTLFSSSAAQGDKTTATTDLPAANLSVQNNAALLQQSEKEPTVITPSPQTAMASSDYMVTAGDIYELSYAAGTVPVTCTIPVDVSYKIRVANLATLSVRGKTFLQIKNQVEEIVTKNYPLGGAQFVLLTPAAFKVTIKGEVQQTTVKQAWALTRLSSLVNNLLTDYSSLRNVDVQSTTGETHTYDLFKASRFGDLTQDPYVRPDDVIIIHRSKRKVTITGAVERPGTYELLDGENLKALITYYGSSLVDQADTSRMELTRTINQQSPSGEKIYLKQDAIDSDYALLCYDSLSIPLYTDLKPVMFMEGALYATPGTTPESSTRITISFTTGENYASLIRDNKKMFSAVSDTQHAYIIRENKIIPINMNRILYDASYYTSETVQSADTLMVPFRQYFVTVSGAVETPGRYPYIPNRDWTYYVGLAGGFSSDENSFNAISITDINGRHLKKTDPITPETNILAQTNSFTFYFSKYAPVLTTILSSLSTIFTIYAVTR